MWSHGAAAVYLSDHVCRVRVSIPSRTQQEGPAQSCQPQQEVNYCLLALRGRGCESVVRDSKGAVQS